MRSRTRASLKWSQWTPENAKVPTSTTSFCKYVGPLKSGWNVGSNDPFVSSNEGSEEMVFEGHLRNIDTTETRLVVFKDGGENQAFFDHGEFHTFRDFEKKCLHRNQFSHGNAEGDIFGGSGA